MLRNWLPTLLTVALVLPAGLSAQEAPRPRRRPEPRAFSFSFENRGRIGVVVSTTANSSTDKFGARIDAVTPGGPAEKAGLKAGDVITKFNGTSLAGVSGDEDEDESGPGRKLIELARDVEPGDTVRIEYRRGADTKPVTLVAEDLGYAFAMPRMSAPSVLEVPRGAPMALLGDGAFSFCFGDSWCDLELVTLNADLGEYFGAQDGVLVIKAPADSALPLKSGDVIVSIGGRKPASPSHAMRILRSYEAGETVSIEILRHQKRQMLSWKVPDTDERRFRRAPSRSRERGEQSMWRGLEEGNRAYEDALRQMERSRELLREFSRGEARQQLEQSKDRLQDLMRRSRVLHRLNWTTEI